MKRCTKCKKSKPLSDFGRDRGQKDGHKYYCYSCDRAMQSEAHKRRKEGRGRQTAAKVDHICTDECETSRFGFCFKRYFAEQRAHRAGVLLTDAQTRTRTRENARSKARERVGS